MVWTEGLQGFDPHPYGYNKPKKKRVKYIPTKSSETTWWLCILFGFYDMLQKKVMICDISYDKSRDVVIYIYTLCINVRTYIYIYIYIIISSYIMMHYNEMMYTCIHLLSQIPYWFFENEKHLYISTILSKNCLA